MLSHVASSLIAFYIFWASILFRCNSAGPLDALTSWARADRIPIDVNLPWLPCKYKFNLNFNSINEWKPVTSKKPDSLINCDCF